MTLDQQNVIQDQKTIDVKISSLLIFIHSPAFQEIARTEQNRLYVQLHFMQGYNLVLLQRIEAFHQ